MSEHAYWVLSYVLSGVSIVLTLSVAIFTARVERMIVEILEKEEEEIERLIDLRG